MKPRAEPDVLPVHSLEARLFAGDYASRGDILRMKSLGVQWNGNVRMHETPIQKGAAGE